MRIHLLITALESSSTLGGHFFSAITTVRELQTRNHVDLTIIGDKPAEAIEQSGLPHSFCHTPMGPISVGRGELLERLRRSKPDVVIAFDLMAGMIVRPLLIRLDIGFIQVKAGGPLPKGYFPRNHFQVHFSKADARWAAHRTPSPLSKVAWIPNRIEKPTPDFRAIERLRRSLAVAEGELLIMRIGRIATQYRKAFLGAIALTKVYRQQGLPARLIVIGTVTDYQLLNEIRKQVSNKDAVLTDVEYTERAARFLPLGHLNVGVGRGFMEGCAEGHWMMAMSARSELPFVVSEENLMDFFEHNFSLRTPYFEAERVWRQRVFDVATWILSGQSRSKKAQTWYEKLFSSAVLAEKYDELLLPAYKERESLSIDSIRSEISLRYRNVKASVKKDLLRRST